jgi:DNA-directed RNA polymerase specialized sigma24 family protein
MSQLLQPGAPQLRLHQEMVERIAKKMVADEWIAHELAQEAILQAYLSLNHLRDASRFKSWI